MLAFVHAGIYTKIKVNSYYKLITAITLLQGLRNKLQDTFYSEKIPSSNKRTSNFQKTPTKLDRDDLRHREETGKQKCQV